MENLSHLVNLRDLNLSDNKIAIISDIDDLPNLTTLNLNGNHISAINISNSSIQIVKLSRNLIKDTTQLLNLKLLPNLQQISLSDNPFCRTFTYTEFVLFLAVKQIHILPLVHSLGVESYLYLHDGVRFHLSNRLANTNRGPIHQSQS